MLTELGRIFSKKTLVSSNLLLLLGLTVIGYAHAIPEQVFGLICVLVAGYSITLHFRYHLAKLAKEKEQLQLEAHIAGAINKGDFVFHLQPFVCMNTRKVTGAEMLLRMNDSNGNPLSPLVVIDVAKRKGLSIRILEAALEKAQSLSEIVLKTRISINVEPCQFRDKEHTSKTLSLIESFHHLKDYVIFELTETPEDFDINHLDTGIRRIRELGFKVWIDDLGTGQNSLKLWSLIEVDGVKLDRSFRHSLYGEHGQDWLRHIGYFCQCLKISCVVEGIETAEEVEIISGLNFAIVQGFYFYRPMSEKKFVMLMLEGQTRDCANCSERCSHVGRFKNLPGDNDIALSWI